MNHYAHYICRGVKNKNGCTNNGRVPVADFEAKMFQHVLRLNDFNKQSAAPTNDTLNELENKLARNQTAIGRYMKLLETDDLADMKELTANLSRLKAEQSTLVKDIDAEKAKSSVISNSPAVFQMLRDRFSNKNAKVVDGVLRLTAVSKGMLDAELKRIKDRLKDTEERKRIKNMMPTVFDGIRIQFGKEVKAFCQFLSGTKSTVVIRRGETKQISPSLLPGLRPRGTDPEC